ncbi:hypothetical protein B0A55_08860 [Friedmanniomyces simplex]|uniref:Glutathione S-transferase kappa n=1 Tax=Friedmanniomyces simplex TaxID=329884 RepID=A0A4U0WZM4_9PEZI|nr:hypothetical protein B0A55_08860 [Friedmanniomyces simplex]
MAPKKIECYIDCVSPYSYYAFVFLKKNRTILESHGVEVEFIPVFLGGINVGSGNKPPGELPAKANYSRYDSKRAQKYFGLEFETPEFFPILSLRPQRCLIYTQSHYPRSTYESLWLNCFRAMWNDHLDLSISANMLTAVQRTFPDNAQDISAIMSSSDDPEIKGKLTANTEHAFKDLGAFGCPWFWVTDGEGKGEPFFGSDRWGFMWEFLGVPGCGYEVLGVGERTHVETKTLGGARL